jgi:hypothetical protein
MTMTDIEFLTEMWPGWSDDATYEIKTHRFTGVTFVRIDWEWLGHACTLLHDLLPDVMTFDVVCNGAAIHSLRADDSVMLSHEPYYWTQQTVQIFLYRLLYRDDGTSRHPGLKPL